MSTVKRRLESAILAIVLASLTLPSSQAAPATADCIAGPNTSAPQGSRWYYRSDRTTHRRCWFLAPQHPAVQLTSRKSRFSAIPLPRPRPVVEILPAQPNSTDPHAEFTVGGGWWRSPEQPETDRTPFDPAPTAGATKQDSAFTNNPNPDEHGAGDSPRELSLISPVSAVDHAPGERVPLSTLTLQRILLVLLGASGLVWMGCHASLMVSAKRTEQLDQLNHRDRFDLNGAQPSTWPSAALSGAADSSRRVRDDADAAREPYRTARDREIEAELHQILQRWARRAAQYR